MSFSASDLMSANVAIVIINIWAAALFIASRVQKRKEVQGTAAKCKCTGLQQPEPPDDKHTASSTLNSPLFGELSVRQPKPYLLLLPAELNAMILRNLTSFQDLQSLTQAIPAYHDVAERDNIFTEATINELESRNISFLPRDLAWPDTRIVHSLSIYVRIPDCALEKCKKSELLQAVEAYVWNHNSNGKHLRFTIEQCLAILSVLEVDHWMYCLSAKPGPLTKDVNEPRERIYLFHDYFTGVYLDVANNSGPYIEEDTTREKRLLLIIKKIRKRSTSIGHIHNLCLSPTPSIVSYRELCDKSNFSALRN